MSDPDFSDWGDDNYGSDDGYQHDDYGDDYESNGPHSDFYSPENDAASEENIEYAANEENTIRYLGDDELNEDSEQADGDENNSIGLYDEEDVDEFEEDDENYSVTEDDINVEVTEEEALAEDESEGEDIGLHEEEFEHNEDDNDSFDNDEEEDPSGDRPESEEEGPSGDCSESEEEDVINLEDIEDSEDDSYEEGTEREFNEESEDSNYEDYYGDATEYVREVRGRHSINSSGSDARNIEKQRIGPANNASGTQCVVCMDAPYQVLFSPCAHVCCCINCAYKLNKCPLCRITIEEQTRAIVP